MNSVNSNFSLKGIFLAGEMVLLRPLLENDADGNYPNWFNDAEVCLANSHHVFPYTRAQALAYIQSQIGKTTILVLAVVDKITQRHIGNISLQDINFIHRAAELAIIIGEKESWSKGYGKEAAFLLVQHAFAALNLHRITSGTLDTNIGFQKIAASLGMTQEGIRRKALFKDGRYHDVLEYGLLREEFEARFIETF